MFGQCINYVHLVKPHPLVAWKQVNYTTWEKHLGRWRKVFFTTFSLQGRVVCPLFRIYQRWWLGMTRSYGTTRLYAQESRDIFSLVSSRYHNLFHWIQEKELVSGNKLEWAKRQLYSLSLSLSCLPSFFPFAPFAFSLVFLIDCLKQTWFSLLYNFLFTSSIWVAFQCNIHKQQTL